MPYHITESCTGCTGCLKICPVFAIEGKKDQRHIINEKRCVECGVCGRVCPRSAINDNTGKACSPLKRSQWPKPVINTELCSACGICVNECNPGALRISEPRFKGDIKVYAELLEGRRCVGCGICMKLCPLEIITMENPQAQTEADQ